MACRLIEWLVLTVRCARRDVGGCIGGMSISGCNRGDMRLGTVVSGIASIAGVLFRVCLVCMRAVVHSRRGAVGCVNNMGAGVVSAVTLCCVSWSMRGTDTLCCEMGIIVVSAGGDFCVAMYRWMRVVSCSRLSFWVSLIVCVSSKVSNSFVSSDRCSLGVSVGRTQCCGKSWAEPDIRYAFVSGT